MDVKVRHLVKDTDRHGNDRYYFRMPGRPKIRLREPFGSDAFQEELRCARLGLPYRNAATQPKPAKQSPSAEPGTLKWLVLDYLRRGCSQMAPGTLSAKTNTLTAICNTPIEGEKVLYGRLPYRHFKTSDVEYLRDLRADQPNAANSRVDELRVLFVWAMETNGRDGKKLADVNPAAGLKRIRVVSDGHHTWTAGQIRQFQEKHPVGTIANLACRLIFFTAARCVDAVKLGRQHLYERDIIGPDGQPTTQWRLRFTPQKTAKSTGVIVDVAVEAGLAQTLALVPKTQLTFLQRPGLDKPYSAGTLSNLMSKWCDDAGLPECTAHGLRKAFSTLMAEDGATPHQIMARLGWSTTQQAEIYTRAADRRRLADEGGKHVRLR